LQKLSSTRYSEIVFYISVAERVILAV
jgi:hypothetical protein